MWGIKESTKEAFTLFEIQQMTWPQNASELRLLSITGLQAWYLSKDPRHMIFLGQDAAFKRFIFWHYTLPVRFLRAYYKVKRFLTPSHE